MDVEFRIMHPARRRTLSVVIPALVLAVGLGLSLPVAASPAPVSVATHAVPTALGGLGRAVHLGAADGSGVRQIGVFLQRPDPAGEDALLRRLHDPASPDYGRFLTPAAFDARFGVRPAQVSAVRSWLAGGGLVVDTVAGDGGYLTAHGPVAALDRLFGVAIGRYRYGHLSFLANDRAPRVPVSLPISAVVGLDSLHRFSMPARLSGSRRAGRAVTAGSRPAAGSFSGILQPSDLWRIYDQPSSVTGQGQVIGVFGEGDPAPTVANLRLFEQHFGLPKVPVRVVLTEPGPASAYGDNAGNIEWELDSQASTGMAPGVARLDLYFAKGLMDADVYASFQKWADDLYGPLQMNASFGECETGPLNPLLGPLSQQPYGTGLGNNLEVQLGGEQILRKAAVEGRTLFAASGDTGSGCDEAVAPVVGAGNGVLVQPVPEVGYPAASQYAVAVGGTVVTAGDPDHGIRQSEVAWTFTGGGPSHFIPAPAFQQKVVSQNCVSRPDGTSYPSPTPCRGVPDVATLSGNVTGNGYAMYMEGNLSSEGGTSLSSPLMMGMWARVQSAYYAAHHQTLGFADPSLYRAAASRGTYYDVTAAETPAGNGAYQPTRGWDYTSGLGAPDVAGLIRALVGAVPAHLPTSAAEAPAVLACRVSMASPPGNAVDPVEDQLGNQPGLDLTSTSLSTSHGNVVATISGPAVNGSAATATAGRDLYVLWSSGAGAKAVEYFLAAHIDDAGLVQVTSGQSAGPAGGDYSFTPNPATRATYSVSGQTLTITAPLGEVGGPRPGSVLAYPLALAQEDVGVPNAGGSPWAGLALTADTAAQPVGVPLSRGAGVRVGC